MKVRKLALKRAAAWLMAAAMVTSSVDITTLTVSAEDGTQEAVETVVSEAVENTGTTDGAMGNPGAMLKNAGEEEIFVELPMETVELPELETSAGSFSFWALDNSGKVALKDGNYANWIDRIDATGADYKIIRQAGNIADSQQFVINALLFIQRFCYLKCYFFCSQHTCYPFSFSQARASRDSGETSLPC